MISLEAYRLFAHTISSNAFDVILILLFMLSLVYYIISVQMIFYKKRENKEIDFSEDKAPFVSVQIPTYNELVAIRCAEKCLEFNYPEDKYEVLIGDDSNDPSVSAKLEKFAEKHSKVRILRRGHNIGFKPGNLNNMLKHSKGEIIVIFDSDFVPPQNFLVDIVKPFTIDNNVGAVQARWGFINPNKNLISILASAILSVVHYIVLPFVQNKTKISFLCGSAEAVRKDALVKLGGWQENSMTEDIEYSFRVLKNGYKIIYLEDLKCDGEVPYTPKDFYKQQMRWAHGVTKAYLQHEFGVIRSRLFSLKEKAYISFICSGYLLTFLLLLLFVIGIASFITDTPAPIDIPKFIFRTGRNIIMTSGFLVATAIALSKNKNYKRIPHVIGSSFSYGIVTAYFVNVGIIKAIFRKPMKWYMLNKIGNQVENQEAGSS